MSRIANIIQGCIKGDYSSWDVFVREFSGLVTWSARSHLAKFGQPFTEGDIEDIHQEVFLSLFKKGTLTQLKDASRITFWLASASGNIALNYVRRKKGRLPGKSVSLFDEIARDKDSALTAAETLKSQQPLPDEAADAKLLQETMETAFKTLDSHTEIILKLYYVYDKGTKQIADFLDIPQGSIASAISRSKDKIRQFLEEKGLL